MSDCKMPCRKYKEQIDRLTSEINFLHKVIETNPKKWLGVGGLENIDTVLRDLVYPPTFQSNTICESERTRLQDGRVDGVDI